MLRDSEAKGEGCPLAKAEAKALQPPAGAGVGEAVDLRRYGLDWKARSRMLEELLLAPSTALSAAISNVRLEGRWASSAPPLPSRHDPWRFLRCVWICVIAIAHMYPRNPVCHSL